MKIDLNKLFSDDDLIALSKLWPENETAAAAVVRAIMDLFAAPKGNREEIENLVALLLIGLIGPNPSPSASAWAQGFGNGGFELRPEQRYAMPGHDDRPARFIGRGRQTIDNGTTPAQRNLGITDETAGDGIRLVLASSLAKEFYNLSLAHVALGTAWPVMAAVDKHLTNGQHRALHRHGANDELQAELAKAVASGLESFLWHHFPDENLKGDRAARHKRELPPGTDVDAHFTRSQTAVRVYRRGLLTKLGVEIHENNGEGDASIDDAAAILAAIRPTISATFSYSTHGTSQRHPSDWAASDIQRLHDMMPLLMRTDALPEFRAAAVRARAREFWPPEQQSVHNPDLIGEIRDWVREGKLPPLNLQPTHAHLFEEEACAIFFAEPLKLVGWQCLGFFPHLPKVRDGSPYEILRQLHDAVIL